MQTAKVWTLDDVKADWARVKCEVAYVRTIVAAYILLGTLRRQEQIKRLAAEQLKYSPDQPRVTAGQSGGGQWTDGRGVSGGSGSDVLLGGSGRGNVTSGPDRYRVVLETQDIAFGGHTIRDHVGKTDEYLTRTLQDQTYDNGIYTYGPEAEGSFESKETANDLVNRVLETYQADVDEVAGGKYESVLNKRFGYPTGKEAYRPDADTKPYIRNTYAVRVVLRHDPRSNTGYKVLTAFPVNHKSQR